MTPAQRDLKSAISDTRTVGVILAVVGMLPLLVLVYDKSAMRNAFTFTTRLYILIDTAILVGPGVWYFVAARLMRQLNRQVVVVSRRIAVVQLVLVVAMLVFGFEMTQSGMLMAPAFLAMFFVPALIALLFVLRRVGHAMDAIEPGGHGFEALPVETREP